MAGSILQLVANTGPQDSILMSDPQITFFKKLYRRHTTFAIEDIRVNFENRVDFGSGARVIIPKSGDLLRRIYVVIEIPSIAAAFLNTKTEDMIQLVQNFPFSDTTLRNTLISSIHRETVELPVVLNTIYDTEQHYLTEIAAREHIFNEICRLTDSGDSFDTFGTKSTFDPNVCTDLRTSNVCRSSCVNTCACNQHHTRFCITKKLSRCVTLGDLEDSQYDFDVTKMSLTNIWITHKPEYALSYYIIQMEYLTNRYVNSFTPMMTTSTAASVILYEKLFNEVVPNREILNMFYIANVDVTNNLQFSKLVDPFPSALEIFDGKINELNNIVTGATPYRQHIYDLYSDHCPKRFAPKTFDPDGTDIHTMLVQATQNKSSDPDVLLGIQKQFTLFGSDYYYVLNSYATIINVVRTLARTTPIIVSKTYGLTRPNVNIYRDLTTSLLNTEVYPTILDPNFANSYLLKVNDLQTPCSKKFCDTSVPIYPNEFVNAYLTLFNQHATAMMNNITNGMNTLFSSYKTKLFTDTSTLFLDNRPPMRTIYSYSVPTRGYIDQEELRIQNVMNLNIWFFYFFNYLGRFRGENYVNYLMGYARTNISPNGAVFTANLIRLLQLNLEYYMHEISYNLNDLYAHSPSNHPDDSLKTYVPVAFSPVIQKSVTSPQIRVATDLLATTMIFHRNHVPTILEMFQFIYYFIDRISVADMNNNPCADPPFVPVSVMDPEEECNLRHLVKLFYYQVFGYFMDIYDSFGFEAPANFSTTEYDTCDIRCDNFNIRTSTNPVSFTSQFNADVDGSCLSKIVQQYVAYFLKGVQIRPALFFNQTQPVIPNISQMEFYFVSEMLNMRQQQKLYHNVLFNTELISSTVGSTSAHLIRTVVDQIVCRNTCSKPDMCKIDSCSDRTRIYWDKLYQTSMLTCHKESLYYATFNTRRYVGLPYKNTAYMSRNYGQVIPPISEFSSPLPPTNPYGINPAYYNHRNVCCSEKEIPVYWVVNSRSNGRVDTLPAESRTDEFQIFEIDYFRIKHSIFYDERLILPGCVRTIDTYQNCLLASFILTERLRNAYPHADPYLINRLLTSVYYLLEETNTSSCYVTYLRIYDLGCRPTFTDMLNAYFSALTTKEFSENLIDEALNCLREMMNKFDSGIIIQKDLCCAQVLPIQYDDLIALNSFTENITKSSSSNILDILEFLQKVYLTHYFYYSKKNSSVVSLHKLSITESDTTDIFRTTHDIMTDILTAMNISDFDTIIEEYLDDLSQQILRLFMDRKKIKMISAGDVYHKLVTIYDISLEISKDSDIHRHLLQKYQPYLLAKIELIHEIIQYVVLCSNFSDDNVNDIVEIGKKYGVNLHQYVVSKLLPALSSICNKKKRIMMLCQRLHEDIDKLLLQSIGVKKCRTFKECIIYDLPENPKLTALLESIPDEYLPYVLFVIETVGCVEPINPIYRVSFDADSIVKFYDSFKFVPNFLMYLMDYVWDDVMLLHDRYVDNWMGFEGNFSRVINSIHFESTQKTCEELRMSNMDHHKNISVQNSTQLQKDKTQIQVLTCSAIDTNNILCELRRANHLVRTVSNSVLFAMCESDLPEETKIEMCSQEIECVDIPDGCTVSNANHDFQKILRWKEHNEIVCYIKEVAGRSLILLSSMRTELDQFKKQLSNITYRNRRAKVAWVRKLAHFLIETVTMRFGDQTLDIHKSDWFESFHALSGTPEHESGYLKMIGHREDLIVYNDKVKCSYQIVLPLVFYFNRNPALAIPLNASIHTQFELSLNLRKIDDVIYKEQFSDFVDPVMLNNTNVDLRSAKIVPSIQDAYLMCEYIYLSTEERHVFVTNRLDYFMEEVQTDSGLTVTDSNLEPMYLLKRNRELVTENGVRELGRSVNLSVCPRTDLVPRSDIVWDNIGGKIVARCQQLPIDKYIQTKRIRYRHYFHNPAELMVFLIKPMIHTQLMYRTDESNYFYGEKQWDNYNLYSYYDLSGIQRVKTEWLDTVRQNMDNVDVNYLRILNQMLLEPSEEDDGEMIQFLKDSFMNYAKPIENYHAAIRLKENLLSLSINFDITSWETLEELIQETVQLIREENSIVFDVSPLAIKEAYDYSTNTVKISRETFRLIIMRILINLIDQLSLTVKQIDRAIDLVYDSYNEEIINEIMSQITSTIDITQKPYDIMRIIRAGHEITPDVVDVILNVLTGLSATDLRLMNTDHINHIWYKNIIYQTTLGQISHSVISHISAKMNSVSNRIYNEYLVILEDYEKHMILNPVVNPLMGGYISFNDANLMPINSDAMWLTTASAYKYAKRTPHTNINIFSWSLDPFSEQISGAVNLSRIDDFSSIYDLHPKISSEYPATIVTMIMSLNIIRFLSGLCGKAWESV